MSRCVWGGGPREACSVDAPAAPLDAAPTPAFEGGCPTDAAADAGGEADAADGGAGGADAEPGPEAEPFGADAEPTVGA